MDNINTSIKKIIEKNYPHEINTYLTAPYVVGLPEYLGSDEKLEAVLFGKVNDFPWPSSGGLWATNKRLLFVSKHLFGKGVVDFTYDKVQSISLIPSWPHSVSIRTGSLMGFLLQYVDNEVANRFVNQVRLIMDNRQTSKMESKEVSVNENDLVKQLEKLAQLREKGLIDESEFVLAKKKLLG